MQGIGNDRPLDHTGIAERGRLVAIGIDAAADLALGADSYISVTASQGCGVRRAVFGCLTGAIVVRGRFAGRVGEVDVGFNVAIYFGTIGNSRCGGGAGGDRTGVVWGKSGSVRVGIGG